MAGIVLLISLCVIAKIFDLFFEKIIAAGYRGETESPL
jgi:hypothetical protein